MEGLEHKIIYNYAKVNEMIVYLKNRTALLQMKLTLQTYLVSKKWKGNLSSVLAGHYSKNLILILIQSKSSYNFLHAKIINKYISK